MRVIAGSAKGRYLKTPRGKVLRPTSDKVKAAFFNIIGDLLLDACFLDLFAGSGSIGIEAISRGAKRCVFVEKEAYAVKLIKENIRLMDNSMACNILHVDGKMALRILSQRKDSFHIIYIDPPYNYQKISLIGEELLGGGLLKEDGLLCVERSSWDELLWLQLFPLPLWQKKIYGDTMLLLFKK